MQAIFNGKSPITPVTIVCPGNSAASIKIITTIGAVVTAIEGGIPLGDCPCAMDSARIKIIGPTISVAPETTTYVGIVLSQVLNLFNKHRKTKQARISPGLKSNTNGLTCARRWYYTLEALEAFGYTKENIALAFDVNTEADEYFAVDHIGYFYLIGQKYPEYVNWETLFMKGPDPWGSVQKMFDTTDMRDRPETLLEAAEFFHKMDMAAFAKNGNDAGRVMMLKDAQLRANLVLDVYHFDIGYYTYPGFNPEMLKPQHGTAEIGVLDSRNYTKKQLIEDFNKLKLGDLTDIKIQEYSSSFDEFEVEFLKQSLINNI